MVLNTKPKIKLGQIYKHKFLAHGQLKSSVMGQQWTQEEHFIIYEVEKKQSEGNWGLKVLVDTRNKSWYLNRIHWFKSTAIYETMDLMGNDANTIRVLYGQ